MNQLEEQLKKLRTTTLSSEARERMRAELFSYAQMHASSAVRRSVPSPFAAMRMRVYAGMSAAVLLVVALGGTAYASERALPGDALYSVKVGIAEPLQTALVPSDRGKAAWHAILAERRLEEAAQLAADGKLSTSTQDELATNFTSQVVASQESADRLQHNGDTSGSLSVRSDLEARLSAHAQILSIINAHFADATTTNAEATHAALGHLLALVIDHEKAVASSRIALEDVISPDSDTQNDTAASASTTLALVSKEGIPHRPKMHVEEPQAKASPAAQVQTAASIRTIEVEDILERHAALLKAFFPVATTSATSTATTTISTEATSTVDLPH